MKREFKNHKKPYYFVRNGLLLRRREIMEAVQLTDNALKEVYAEFSKYPYAKQDILEKRWDLEANFRHQPVLDGYEAVNKNIDKMRKKFTGVENV